MNSIAASLAKIYGYKTLGGLISANTGLIAVLTALICVTLVFRAILNRQYPRGGPQPFTRWLLKVSAVFFIAAFVFVAGFTVFHERKKEERQSRIAHPSYEQLIDVKYIFA